MVKLPEREPHSVYLERFVMMLMLLVPSVFLQGWRTVFVAAMSIVMCMIIDVVCSVMRKIPYSAKDWTVPFWGLAAALMMPSTISVPLILLSSVLCVGVGKHLFGGSDNIVFCPPAISTAFLIICYPGDMLYFPKFGEKISSMADFSGTAVRSVEYSLNIHNVPTYSTSDVLMGLVPGPVGVVYAGIILICGVCMILRRSNSGLSMLSCLGTAGLLAFFFPRAGYSGLDSVIYELFSGYLMFGAVFLSAEPYRIPTRPVGKILYGIMLGYTAMMFRYFGQTEGGFLFALLITCALCSSFDRLVENMVYWKKTYLNSFEKGKKLIQEGGTEAVKLTDTQEIVLPEKYNYNMPPINSRITRKSRVNKKEARRDEDEVKRIIAEMDKERQLSDTDPDGGNIRDIGQLFDDDSDAREGFDDEQ